MEIVHDVLISRYSVHWGDGKAIADLGTAQSQLYDQLSEAYSNGVNSL